MQNPWSETLPRMASGHSLSSTLTRSSDSPSGDWVIRSSALVVLYTVASTSITRCGGVSTGQTYRASPLSWQLHVPKGRGDSAPCPWQPPGAATCFCTLPYKERPARGPGEEAQKARRVMVGRFTPRCPRSQRTQSQLQAAGWVWP